MDAILVSSVQSSPHSSKELQDSELTQAMQVEISNHTVVPESTVTNIFKKAEKLMTDSHAITAAPLQGVARMVKSRSNPSRPYLIKVLKGGKVVCDENCLVDFIEDLLSLCGCCIYHWLSGVFCKVVYC